MRNKINVCKENKLYLHLFFDQKYLKRLTIMISVPFREIDNSKIRGKYKNEIQ